MIGLGLGLGLGLGRSNAVGPITELSLAGASASALTNAGYTFTRSGTAYVVSGSDYIAKSTNEPRLETSGLLIEGARTNAISQSNDLTSWTVVSATNTAGYGSSPFGALASNRVQFTGTGAFQLTQFTPSGIAAASAVAYSAILKGSGTLHMDASAGTAAPSLSASWARYGYNGTDGAGNTACRLISYPGDTAADFEVAHFQAEVAAFRSSPIVTAGATVTRAAETCIGTLASIPTSWVWVFHFTTADGKSGDQILAQADDGTADNRITVRRTSGGAMTVDVVVATVTVASINAGTAADSTAGKVAVRIKLNDMAASLNGAAEVVDTSAAVPTVTTLRLGHNHTPANHWFGSIAKAPALGVWRPATASLTALSA
jgi:hypothetical protein